VRGITFIVAEGERNKILLLSGSQDVTAGHYDKR